MKLNQIIVLVSLFGAYGNIVGQDAKTPIPIKPEKNQLQAPDKQPGVPSKVVSVRKSLNPDRLDFIGVPSVIKDSN